MTLTVKECGGEAMVSIKDNGIGIAPETLPKLFRMFSQDAPALEKAQGGLGIGLSLVKAFVEMHGGAVEARSEGIDRGSEFIVRLPTAARWPSAASASQRQPTSRPGLSILVADDNRDARETLAVLLGTAGHEVRVACDGQEAVDLALATRPRVALLDIGMPKLTGYHVAERLRKELPGCVLVATTGWGERDDMRRTAAAGFQHHLVKPIEPDQLFALLAALQASHAVATASDRPGDAA